MYVDFVLRAVASRRAVAASLLSLSAAALIAAVFLQAAWALYPCSLCILQRYAFLGIGLGAALLLVANRPWAHRAGMAIAGLSAAGGAWAAVKNLWVLKYPSPSCGRDPVAQFLQELPWVQAWPAMFEPTGMCSDPIPDVLGLSFPAWALLCFAATLTLLGVSAWLRAKSAS